SGPSANEFQYRGEQFDTSLGMYYLRARYYRPQIGRFLTQDTYEGDDEEPVTLHKYLYANADPVDARDPGGNEVDEAVALDEQVTTQKELQPTKASRGITLDQVQNLASSAWNTI